MVKEMVVPSRCLDSMTVPLRLVLQEGTLSGDKPTTGSLSERELDAHNKRNVEKGAPKVPPPTPSVVPESQEQRKDRKEHILSRLELTASYDKRGMDPMALALEDAAQEGIDLEWPY